MLLTKIVAIASLAIAAVAQQQTWPVFERDGKTAVLNAINNYVAQGEAAFASAGLQRMPSPGNWAEEVVYHIVPDRFNDGNPNNNKNNLPRDGQAVDQPAGNYFNINEWRQGGDLAGIQARIGYLVDLGISTIWITPIVQHKGDYHGYCSVNPSVIDPGFGTNEDFRELVRVAHANGIRVVMDIVVNHLCDADTSYKVQPSNHYQCTDSLENANKYAVPADESKKGQLRFSPNFFGPLQSQYFYSRCGSNSGEDTTGQGSAAVYGDFADGFFDYDTTNYDFMEIFTNLHKYWIAYADIDGFRMDAAKHITEAFIAHFSTNIRDYANKLGKNNFYVIGEVAADVQWEGRRLGNMFHNPFNPDQHGDVPATLTNKIKDLKSTYLAHPTQKFPGLTAIYDFFLGGTTRFIVLNYNQKADGTATDYNASPARIGDYFGNQYNTVNAQAPMTNSWLPMEIHDWPRLLKNQLNNDPVGTLAFAFGFLFTMQGQPILYYGSEQGFSGDCNYNAITGGTKEAYDHIVKVCNFSGYEGESHSTSRQPFFLSSGFKLRTANPTTDAFAKIGPAPAFQSFDWKSDPYLDRNNFIYIHTRRLIHIRRSCAPLRNGAAYIRKTDDYGLIAFSRVSNYEAVVLMNVKRNGGYTVNSYTISVDFNLNAEGTKFVNLLNPSGTAAYVRKNSSGGKVLDFGPGNFNLDRRGYAIFVPESAVKGYDSYFQATLCNN
ncbi:hypothetical protein HDU97_008034 [Phlyctochytrium planicorne]|nr:hypothetical protein HDU97_008034 [Phlyctochytrium planicorne]